MDRLEPVTGWLIALHFAAFVAMPLVPGPVHGSDADACQLLLADGFEGGCDTQFNIDIPVVDLVVTFTINGDSPPASDFEKGELSLRNLDTGDHVVIGESSVNGGVYNIVTIAGTYQVFWELVSGGSSVPVNHSAALGTIEIAGDDAIAVDMPMVSVSGTFTLDGGSPPASSAESADIYLRNPATGDEVYLGSTADGSYLVNMVPGTYDVVYELAQGGLVMPLNAEHLVMQVEIPNAPEIIIQRDIPLLSGLISGDIAIDGQTPPGGNDDFGLIRFRDTVTGDEVPVGNTRNATYLARLLAGEYDVVYQAEQPGAVMPVNRNAILVPGHDLGQGSFELNLDLPVVDLQGVVTLNGDVPPASGFEDGFITLWSPGSGDEAVIGLTSESGGELAARVIPGTYEALWELDNGGTQVPGNRRAALGPVTVTEGLPVALDIPMVTFAGSYFLDGATPPTNVFESARISVINRTTSDDLFLGETTDGSFLTNIIPGPYETVYELEAGGTQVPRNGRQILGDLCVQNVGTEIVFEHDVHLQSLAVAGDIRFNGEIPIDSGFETGDIVFRDPVTADEIPVGRTRDGAYDALLLTGTYEVYYSLESGGTVVPRNTHARVGTFSLCPTVE